MDFQDKIFFHHHYEYDNDPNKLSQTFEILLFSYDNHNPFVYTGSITSQQEVVCYQIELVDLILPNRVLNCGNGSRVAFYPYIYVEITNISGSSSGMKNCIYSNNPIFFLFFIWV